MTPSTVPRNLQDDPREPGSEFAGRPAMSPRLRAAVARHEHKARLRAAVARHEHKARQRREDRLFLIAAGALMACAMLIADLACILGPR